MASPALMVRQPVQAAVWSYPGVKVPRSTLAIPTSPNQRPGNSAAAPLKSENLATPPLSVLKQQPPKLSLATPVDTCPSPQENQRGKRKRPLLVMPGGRVSASHSSNANSAPNTPNSFGGSSSTPNGSVSTKLSTLALNVSELIQSNNEYGSAIEARYSSISPRSSGSGMERDNSMQGTRVKQEKLEKLAVEKGKPLDVRHLDEMGWKAAKKEGRIVELGSLGEGGGGSVTRCILKDGKTIFALKIITTNSNLDVKKQIVRELSFSRTCASEHICEYYGTFTDDAAGTIGISMEFCEGGSLDSVYREIKRLGGRIGEKVLGKVAESVLNGLDYLNGHRIIHRDIKPSNILLTRKGAVKLCDFGVSGDFGIEGDANTFIGTSYYMAPERITGQSYTITSDVWSLGVTLLEVAQHRFPFPADGTETNPRASLIDLLTYIVRQPSPKLRDEAEKKLKWSNMFKYFIECCLEKEPSRRATPWRMLVHPWMREMKAKTVDMGQFLKTVWDWQNV